MTYRYKHLIRVKAKATAITLLLLVTSGCGTVYLHSQARQDNATAARAAYDNAAPEKVFEAERAHIEKLAGEENRIVLDQLRAIQYRSISNLIAPPSPQSEPAWKRIKQKASNRLNKILGQTTDLDQKIDYTDPSTSKSISETRAKWLSANQFAVNALQSDFRYKATRYRQSFNRYILNKGTQADPCHDLVEAGPRKGSPPAKDPNSGNYVSFPNDCRALRTSRRQLKAIYDRAGFPDRAKAANWKDSPRSGYQGVEYQIWMHKKLAKEQRVVANKIKNDLRCFEAQYRAAVQAAGGHRTALAVKAWASAVRDYLALLEDPKKLAEALSPNLTAAAAIKPVEPLCEIGTPTAPIPPTASALFESAGLDVKVPAVVQLVFIKQLLPLIQNAVAFERRKFLDNQLGVLVTSLATLGTETEALPDDNAIVFALTAIDVIDAIRDLADATASPPRIPSLNALLVEQEYQRYLLATAKTEQVRSENKLKILEGQRQALEIEASWLAGAYLDAKAINDVKGAAADCVRKGNDGVAPNDFAALMAQCGDFQPVQSKAAQALSKFNNSWTQGRIPFELGHFALVQMDRQAAVTLAQSTAITRGRMVATALDELKRWGEGGITQDQLLGLAQALGIAVIGVNTGD
jgi:hypothetical protein